MARKSTEGFPKVSIIVPAFNDEAFLSRALDSCLAQSYRNVEILVVDDGSEDATADIMRDYAGKDARVKTLCLEDNGGTHNARARGLEMASGELVTFLDADDELSHDACQCIISNYMKEPFDILHFSMKVVEDGKAAPGQRERLELWTRPLSGTLQGRAMLERSFKDLDYSFSLASKAYKTELAKRAFSSLGSFRCDFGEDAVEYFAVAFFAKSYRGLPHRKLYVYHLGDGLSALDNLNEQDFARSLRGILAIDELKGFLEREGCFESLEDIFEAHRMNQLEALVQTWHERVVPSSKQACLAAILQTWPIDETITSLCKLGSGAIAEMRSCLGRNIPLTEEQSYLCGYADGMRCVREEYESSSSYKLGRTLSAVPRKLLGRS